MIKILKLNILERYIFKEIMGAWLGTTLILLMIFLANILILILEDIMEGLLPLDALLPMFIAQIVRFSVTLLPLGLYLGVIIGLGRLYKDSEMAVMAACGWTPLQTLKISLIFATVIASVMFLFTLYISPIAAAVDLEMQNKMKRQSQIYQIESGKFNMANNNKAVMFTQKLSADKTHQENIFLFNDNKNITTIENAKTATIENIKKYDENYFIFKNGNIINKQNDRITITEFAEHGTKFGTEKTTEKTTLASIPTMDLFKSVNPRHIGELQWRISMPLATILLVALAVPLSYSNPRAGKFGRLMVALVTYIGYSNILIFSKRWIMDGTIPGYIGMWWTHLLALLVVYMLIKKQYGKAINTKKNKVEAGKK
ncbi:MAG: LPS export ABC transporter permease LptF [Gammaproteobacteria bacterium]|nr:MAG: LPS export ABC transporter permease LptF [Gammaproteobacteria bacterium]